MESLLHGDLWGGNYLVDENGYACLIDPAVYYGNREADLAMTKLFGGLDLIQSFIRHIMKPIPCLMVIITGKTSTNFIMY